MSDRVDLLSARQDFGNARRREIMTRVLTLLKPQKEEMLSLGDVRRILRPESETYQGLKTVPIDRIVGSEGRYLDFNRTFLPRHDKLMRRWITVDLAHHRNIILPPVKLFEIGGVYFVRDGNHRVSVARMQGAEFIDADVTSLASEVRITPDMTRDDVKRAVIDFERRRFFEETGLNRLRPGARLEFTEVGRYDEIMDHVNEHKWYINKRKSAEIPLEQAVVSWYDLVYAPIESIILEAKLIAQFPGKTPGDLYVFIGHHWAELGKRYGPIFTLEEAAEDFCTAHTLPWVVQVWRRARDGLTEWARGVRKLFRM